MYLVYRLSSINIAGSTYEALLCRAQEARSLIPCIKKLHDYSACFGKLVCDIPYRQQVQVTATWLTAHRMIAVKRPAASLQVIDEAEERPHANTGQADPCCLHAEQGLPTLDMPVATARLQGPVHASSEVQDFKHQVETLLQPRRMCLSVSKPPIMTTPTSPRRCCRRCPPPRPAGSSTLHGRWLHPVRLLAGTVGRPGAWQPLSTIRSQKAHKCAGVASSPRHCQSAAGTVQATEQQDALRGSATSGACDPAVSHLQQEPSAPHNDPSTLMGWGALSGTSTRRTTTTSAATPAPSPQSASVWPGGISRPLCTLTVQGSVKPSSLRSRCGAQRAPHQQVGLSTGRGSLWHGLVFACWYGTHMLVAVG